MVPSAPSPRFGTTTAPFCGWCVRFGVDFRPRGCACNGGCTLAVEVSDIIFVAILVVIRGCEPRYSHPVQPRLSSIGGSSKAPILFG